MYILPLYAQSILNHSPEGGGGGVGRSLFLKQAPPGNPSVYNCLRIRDLRNKGSDDTRADTDGMLSIFQFLLPPSFPQNTFITHMDHRLSISSVSLILLLFPHHQSAAVI